MSEVRRLQLKVVDAPATRPKWLTTEQPVMRRAAFDPRPPFEEEAASDTSAESTGIYRSDSAAPDGSLDESSGMLPAPPRRRSSLPPRKSVPPPPVVITGLPPLPEFANAEPPPVSEAEQRFAEAALELGSLRARIVSTIEAQLLELSVDIAEAIIEREIARDPAVLSTLAKTALSALGDTTSSRLRVSREAHRTLSQLYGEAAVDVDGVRVDMVLDNSLEGLDVVAETPASRVDGRLKERLSAVLRALEAEQRHVHDEEEEA